jgi:hypothetical protein
MKLQSYIGAIALVVLGSVSTFTAHTAYSQTALSQKPNSNMLSNRSVYRGFTIHKLWRLYMVVNRTFKNSLPSDERRRRSSIELAKQSIY